MIGVVLLQSFNHVKIRQSAMISVHACFAIWSDEHRSDGFHSGGIGRDKWFPERTFAAREFDDVNLCRNFSWAIDVKCASIGSPIARLFAREESLQWLGITTRDREQIW